MDTLTLILDGDIPLDLFARAVTYFSGMVGSLSDEVADEEPIEWEIEHLHAGSAVMSVIARSDDVEAVDRIVRAYDEIGEALSRKEPVPYSPTVASHAYALAALLNGKITSMSLETRLHTFKVTEAAVIDTGLPDKENRRPALGELRGEVGAVIRRPRTQLTVYDQLFDRGVPCYLADEWRDRVNSLLGQRVAVTGLLYRDPLTGRPVKMRDIVSINVINTPSGDFRSARGVIPWRPGDEPAEVTIRRLRDEHDE